MSKEPSFNNGFITALALFYGHRRPFPSKHDNRIYEAADHLFDIEYPEALDVELKREIQAFVSDVLNVRLNDLSTEETNKLFDRCLKLFVEIDSKCFGLSVKVNYP